MNSQTGPKVVVVDDNPATVYATGRILESGGYQVARATTGNDGLALVSGDTDVVILDVNLPDIDGFEVCRRIRENPLTRRVGVIHLSATNVGDSDRIEGLDAGADTYLTHPIAPPVLLATVRTVMRLRSAEGAVQRSDAKFRTLFEHAPTGIVLLDKDLVVVDMNPKMGRLLGRERLASCGRPLAEFIATEDNQPLADLQHHVRRAQGWNGLLRVRLPDGTPLELEWLVSDRLQFGEAMGMVIDITERKLIEREREKVLLLERAAREEAERLSGIKDEFLATLAHELRNPLAPLRNALLVMEMTPGDQAALTRMRELMNRQLTQMVRLIDDLMDVSRITRGLVDLRRETISLESVIQAAIEISTPLIEAAGHSLALNLPATPVTLDMDPIRGAQIFANLLNNAAKYTPAGGRIEITAQTDKHAVEVCIGDNGMGIPASMIDRIFDMFTQVPQAGDRAPGGLGIGLTLVRRLVEMHDGSIRVASAGLGAGTVFCVRLPLADALAAHTAPALQRDAAHDGAGVKIVVIDDNPDIASSLCDVLGLLGYAASECHSGESGLASVAALAPDIVFVDIGMPEMDGYEVARQIRRHHPQAPPRLIAMTGWGQAEDRQRSVDAGFDLHLVKPVSLVDLQRALQGMQDVAG